MSLTRERSPEVGLCGEYGGFLAYMGVFLPGDSFFKVTSGSSMASEAPAITSTVQKAPSGHNEASVAFMRRAQDFKRQTWCDGTAHEEQPQTV